MNVVAAVVGTGVETAAAASFAQSGEPRAEADDELFAEVEWIEQDKSDAFDRLADRSGNADWLHWGGQYARGPGLERTILRGICNPYTHGPTVRSKMGRWKGQRQCARSEAPHRR